MSKELVISANRHETRVAIVEDEQVVEIYHQRENEYSLAGSIHKGKVTRVLPGMQSAFVDIGGERAAPLVGGPRGGTVAEAWRAWRIHAGLAQVVELVSATNEYLERQEPWRKAKDPDAAPEVAGTLLHAAEAVRLAAALLWPVVPELAGRVLASLGQASVPRSRDLVCGVLDGAMVEVGPAIYPRLEAGIA